MRALGIDSAAHYGALAAEGVTFGVLGGGVNRPYPLANSKLFDEIKKDNPDTSAEFIHNLYIFFSRLLLL